ncbi:hypothetical protein BKI52_00295 [marine bacterium AO1-C]|nr:hypothetical protein BKI52_00295 [marine bacterium AO1-C]
MKRTTRNAAKTKQEIIEKSAPLFNVHGYEGTKMQMIVEATGYQMGGIYRHFGTKKVLAKEVFRYNYQLLKNSYIQGVHEDQSPKEQLLQLLNNLKFTFFAPTVVGGCPILNTAIEADDTDQDFRVLASEGLDELVGIVEVILEKGKKEGDFKPTIKPTQEALYLMTTIEGLIMVAKLKRSRKVLTTIFERFATYINDNILNKA